MTLEYKLLKKAYDDSYLDVSTLVIEDMDDSEYKHFAECIFNNAEGSLRNDLICDFQSENGISIFLVGGGEFEHDFAVWLADAYRDEITDFLVKAQDNYEREACESLSGGAW